MKSKKISRNEKCPCESGLKYKKCCNVKRLEDEKQKRISKISIVMEDQIMKLDPEMHANFVLKKLQDHYSRR